MNFRKLTLNTAIVLSFACGLSGLDHSLFVPIAHAVIGRPLTPMSYAGVARRTTRRAVYASAAVATTAAATSAMMVSTLPAGCVSTLYGTATYYNCAGTYYRPTYNGPDVVYVVEEPPSK